MRPTRHLGVAVVLLCVCLGAWVTLAVMALR
jgi:hypothetical protein